MVQGEHQIPSNVLWPMAAGSLSNHENRPSFWVKATVTKPVWSMVIGLCQVLKTCLRRSGYAQAGQLPNRMTIRASLPLPLDETYFLTKLPPAELRGIKIRSLFPCCHSCPDFHRDKLQQESSFPKLLWTPVFTGVTVI
jgi:hypothetical protein